jgi:tRNA (guanine37-N1)-methyltransferase
MLRIDFVTLFPDMVNQALGHSMLKRASERGLVDFGTVNPRDFTQDRHRTVDDTPYGGGPGMLMKVEPVVEAFESLGTGPATAVVLTDPTGRRFAQPDAQELSRFERIVFLCGHYEGFDHRVRTLLATHVFSIGDFVLTGGELPALVMADAVSRLVPGVLDSEDSLRADSHAEGLLSAPQFTRPESFRGEEVPKVLLSGDHGAIDRWRRRESLRLTRDLRPDLFAQARLDLQDLDVLSS